ncbi:MAG TPA: DUF4062 domain-containing protein [Kiritimatiellia bacterium]|nr:DUF4062 domain-containing protein [Kiritimatiellia bacterium]
MDVWNPRDLPDEHPTFRIFVSSTFDDFRRERDILHAEVFPRLSQWCRERGARFQAVDLRWGISQALAEENLTLHVCIEEVMRCQRMTPRPHFLFMLGQRYGWRPLPREIPATRFRALLDHADEEERHLLHDEKAGWYEEDRNRQIARDGADPETAFVLCSRALPGPEGGARSIRLQEEAVLRRFLDRAAQVLGDEELLDDLCKSATQWEIDIALRGLEGEGQMVGVLRQIRGLDGALAARPPSVQALRYVDHEDGRPSAFAAARLERLKAGLQKQGLVKTIRSETDWFGNAPDEAYLPGFSREVGDALLGSMQREFERVQSFDPSHLDRAAHQRVAWSYAAAGACEGRADLLAQMGEPGSGLLIVGGDAGAGKTALLARYAAGCLAERRDVATVVRFVGLSPSTSNPAALLRSLCDEIAERYGRPAPGSDSYESLVESLLELARLADVQRPLVIVIDAVDQMDASVEPHPCAWVPTLSSPHVQIVMSVSNEFGAHAQRLAARHPAARCLNVGPLGREDARRLLDVWCAGAGRVLQEGQRELVLDAFVASGGRPLFLQLAFAQVRRWTSGTAPKMETTLPELIQAYLDRLEREHEPALVRRFLSLLVAARHGLSEGETLDLLSASDILETIQRGNPDFPPMGRLAFAIWSRMLADVEPYLQERTVEGARLYSVRNFAVREEVARRFLVGTEGEAHDRLASYFRGLADPARDGSWSGRDDPARRGFAEYPYHLQQVSHARPEPLYRLTEDRSFLEGQLQTLEALDASRELFGWVVARVLAEGDLATVIRITFRAQEFRVNLATSFFYKFFYYVDTKPRLARALTAWMADPSVRVVALLHIAYICSEQPAHHALARRILRELAELRPSPVHVNFASWVLCVLRDLVRMGFDEAQELASLVPGCPQRIACARAWDVEGHPLCSWARRLLEPPVLEVPADRVVGFHRLEREFRRGARAQDVTRVRAVATRQFLDGNRSAGFKENVEAVAAGVLMSRGMVVRSGVMMGAVYCMATFRETVLPPLLTPLALLRALARADLRDLLWARLQPLLMTALAMKWIVRDKSADLIGDAVESFEDAMPWTSWGLLQSLKLSRKGSPAATTMHEFEECIVALYRAAVSAVRLEGEEGSAVLGGYRQLVGRAEWRDQPAYLLVVWLWGCVLREATFEDEARRRLVAMDRSLEFFERGTSAGTGGQLEPDTRLADELLAAGRYPVWLVSMALRILGRGQAVAALLERGVARHVDREVTDGVLGDYITLQAVTPDRLREASDQLDRCAPIAGVPNLWAKDAKPTCFLLGALSVLLLAFGLPAADLGPAALSLASAGLLALLYDWNFSALLCLGRFPERRARVGASWLAPVLGAWSACMLIREAPEAEVWTPAIASWFWVASALILSLYALADTANLANWKRVVRWIVFAVPLSIAGLVCLVPYEFGGLVPAAGQRGLWLAGCLAAGYAVFTMHRYLRAWRVARRKWELPDSWIRLNTRDFQYRTNDQIRDVSESIQDPQLRELVVTLDHAQRALTSFRPGLANELVSSLIQHPRYADLQPSLRASAWICLASSEQFRRGGSEEVVRHGFEAAHREDPRTSWALSLLGDYDLRKGRVEQAAAAYTRAVDISPWDYTLRERLADCLARAGRTEESRHQYEWATYLGMVADPQGKASP